MSVYFAQAGAYIKIGFSHAPFSRVATVTTSGTRPADLPRGADATLLGWVPGDTWTEGEWHARFRSARVAGEWFYLDPAVVRAAIWEDPCGIDVERMSAFAVMTADKNPGASRDELAAAGIPVEGVSLKDAVGSTSRRLSGAA